MFLPQLSAFVRPSRTVAPSPVGYEMEALAVAAKRTRGENVMLMVTALDHTGRPDRGK